jgi:hypothetical protein
VRVPGWACLPWSVWFLVFPHHLLMMVEKTLASVCSPDTSTSECSCYVFSESGTTECTVVFSWFRFRNFQEVMEIDEHLLARFSRISEDSDPDVASDRGASVRNRSPVRSPRHGDRLHSSRRHTSHDDREGRTQRRTGSHFDAHSRPISSSATHGRHSEIRQPSPSTVSNCPSQVCDK